MTEATMPAIDDESHLIVDIAAGHEAGLANVREYLGFLRVAGNVVTIAATFAISIALACLLAHSSFYGYGATWAFIGDVAARLDQPKAAAISLSGLLWLSASFPLTLYVMGRVLGHHQDNRPCYDD